MTGLPLVPVIVAGLLAVAALAFVFVLAGVKAAQHAPHPSELDREGRSLLSSIQALRESVSKLGGGLRNVPELRALLEEVEQESSSAEERAGTLLRARASLQTALKGRANALQQLSTLERKAEAETDPGAKAALASALAARQAEVEGYRSIEDKVRGIEAKIREAEAGLAELNARLVAATAAQAAGPAAAGELGGLAQRLRTLGATLDEATQLLEAGK